MLYANASTPCLLFAIRDQSYYPSNGRLDVARSEDEIVKDLWDACKSSL